MIEIFEFIFRDVWHFFGTLLLITVAGGNFKLTAQKVISILAEVGKAKK